MFIQEWAGASQAGSYTYVSTYQNCALKKLFDGNTSSVEAASDTSDSESMSVGWVTITAANASITFTGQAGNTVPSGVDFYVIQLPNPIN